AAYSQPEMSLDRMIEYRCALISALSAGPHPAPLVRNRTMLGRTTRRISSTLAFDVPESEFCELGGLSPAAHGHGAARSGGQLCNGNTEKFCSTSIIGERMISTSCAMPEHAVGSWLLSRRTTSRI